MQASASQLLVKLIMSLTNLPQILVHLWTNEEVIWRQILYKHHLISDKSNYQNQDYCLWWSTSTCWYWNHYLCRWSQHLLLYQHPSQFSKGLSTTDLSIPSWTSISQSRSQFMSWPMVHTYRSPSRHKLVPFKLKFMVILLTTKELQMERITKFTSWLEGNFKPFFVLLCWNQSISSCSVWLQSCRFLSCEHQWKPRRKCSWLLCCFRKRPTHLF